jgi:hypothetical protein
MKRERKYIRYQEEVVPPSVSTVETECFMP